MNCMLGVASLFITNAVWTRVKSMCIGFRVLFVYYIFILYKSISKMIKKWSLKNDCATSVVITNHKILNLYKLFSIYMPILVTPLHVQKLPNQTNALRWFIVVQQNSPVDGKVLPSETCCISLIYICTGPNYHMTYSKHILNILYYTSNLEIKQLNRINMSSYAERTHKTPLQETV